MKASDYVWKRLMIECTASQGKQRKFRVSYLMHGGRLVPAYTVTVDYAERVLDKRTRVRDMNGALVPRYRMIGGVLVPFHDFLSFEGDYLGANAVVSQDLDGGLLAVVHRTDAAPYGDAWVISSSVYRKRDLRDRYDQEQRWRAGDWLWFGFGANSPNPCEREHRESIWEATVEKMGHIKQAARIRPQQTTH